MQSIIEDIYEKILNREGNERRRKSKASEQEEKVYHKLMKELSCEHQELFALYVDLCTGRRTEEDYVMFCKGFRAGIKLMMEARETK